MSGGDPYFGWRELLGGPTETHELPGDHEGIFREPNVRILAEKLRVCLQNAQGSEAHSEVATSDMTLSDGAASVRSAAASL